MGLDWLVQNKPCDDYKEKYYKLKYKLSILNKEGEPSEEKSKLIKELENEFEEISITPVDTLGELNEEEINKLDEIFIGGSFLTSNYDYRGKIIGCADILNEELKEEAYEDHNAEQCIEYAYKLECFLESINKNDDDFDEEEYNDIIKGIKWLKFWGSNGHGYNAWY
jgi:hypothetical protein